MTPKEHEAIKAVCDEALQEMAEPAMHLISAFMVAKDTRNAPMGSTLIAAYACLRFALEDSPGDDEVVALLRSVGDSMGRKLYIHSAAESKLAKIEGAE